MGQGVCVEGVNGWAGGCVGRLRIQISLLTSFRWNINENWPNNRGVCIFFCGRLCSFACFITAGSPCTLATSPHVSVWLSARPVLINQASNFSYGKSRRTGENDSSPGVGRGAQIIWRHVKRLLIWRFKTNFVIFIGAFYSPRNTKTHSSFLSPLKWSY